MRIPLTATGILCVLAFSAPVASGQPPEGADTVAHLGSFDDIPGGDNLLDQFPSEGEDFELVDRLIWLREHPFDLNAVSKEELETIPGVLPAEAAAIITLRKMLKRFSSLDQIAAIEGSAILQKIQPYVYLEDGLLEAGSPRRPVFLLRSRATHGLQQQRGFQQGVFTGSSLKSYSRILIAGSERVQGGVLFEKDSGERTSTGFVSGYISASDFSFVSQAIVGDYTFEAGQGLVFWRGTAFGKGAEAISIVKKSGAGAHPYRSADEFNFLRGVTVTSSFQPAIGEIRFSAFYSRRSLSARSDTPETISSFYQDGLFRTADELSYRNAIHERILGGRVQLSSRADWSLGITYYRSTFDKSVLSDQVFEFKGTGAEVAGVDGNVRFGRITLFGEAARSGVGAGAGIAGVILSLGKKSHVAGLYRDYSPKFNPLHANGFGENGNTQNERGLYFGIQHPVTDWLGLAAYIDVFKFPWRSFSNPLPASGHDFMIQGDVQATRALDFSLRYNSKTIETSASSFDLFREARISTERAQQRARCTATHYVSRNVRLKGRIEMTQVRYQLDGGAERGVLFYQDFQYRALDGFTVEGRLVFFDTDSYESRLYEYENDLRGAYSNPALFGKGRRWYLLVKFALGDMVSVSAKYSETQKDQIASIGSGLLEIRGDVDNRIAVQVDVQL